ncbi:MAG: acetate--CoA ligase [Coriobacteriia bacterium]|nr:acetate--CoA ligase [Coriobacteriia bacterium]
MATEQIFIPTKENQSRAWISSMEEYQKMYDASVKDPEKFWDEQAKEFLYWKKPWDTTLEWDFTKPYVSWFKGGLTNASYNCLDRHTQGLHRNKAAIIWESDGGRTKMYTYQSLLTKVCRFANVLKDHGVKKGDVVAIFMPMVPEVVTAMLACARIGAIHTIIFSGFSSQALRDRIQDSNAKCLITVDAGKRGGKVIPLKVMADEAMLETPTIETCFVVTHSRATINMQEGRDFYYHEETRRRDISNECEPEWVEADHPLFILYTSGSTGKPKGVVHSTGGYLLGCAITTKYVFDLHDEDIYFCSADVGWITGHSYIVYGPLCIGGTSLMFEGIPTYPNAGRFWEICEKHAVNQFYTAPTAIRSLMKNGPDEPSKYNLSNLRILGSVGEPINPEAWLWYFHEVGQGRCSVVDTWWQTESGAHMISNLPGCTPMKPGSATLPFFGVQPIILTEEKKEAAVDEDGRLCIKFPWPSMLRRMWGEDSDKRMMDNYFGIFPGYYFSGDGAALDKDGYYWLKGRVDDVINVSGHRMSTAEVEAALNSHAAVAESAVVGYPHEIKGEGIYGYVVLNEGFEPSDDLTQMIVGHVRKDIGPIASPDYIHFVPDLPKTRSGKIMRRIVRKIAAGKIDKEGFGDLSTLVDPDIVDVIIETRPNA